MKQYWYCGYCESEWKARSCWRLLSKSGEVFDDGEILEIEPPRRMVIRWVNKIKPEFTAEGQALCTIELEPAGTAVKLSITHTIERDPSKLLAGVSMGWPIVLSNLKSILETGSIVVQDDYSVVS
jgi:uncharacterized protein YndB with AHSA1/START domain